MPTVKISELNNLSSAIYTDVVPIVNGGVTQKIAIRNLVNSVGDITVTGTITAPFFVGDLTGDVVGTANTASYVLGSNVEGAVELANTASYVENAQTASYVENAQTASYVENAQTASYVENAQTASYVENAQTASYVENAQTASYVGNALITASSNLSEITFTKGDESTFQIEVTPRQIVETVKNLESFTLVKGTPVYASGSTGNAIHVYAASSSLSSRMPAAYILSQNLSPNQEGEGILSGFINGVDTSDFASGDVVYVGANGGYTNVKPTGSNLIQNLGKVVKAAENGSGVISGAGRANDIPNILEGYIWIGNTDGVAVPSPTSSIQNVISSSYAVTSSYIETAQTASYVLASNINQPFSILEVSGSTSTVIFSTGSLPVTDPGVSGQLWRSGSIGNETHLMVSLG